MKKFKSLISCLLAVIILISACSIASFAFTPEEFNLENVTWEDIMTMSNSDFRKLLSDFERVYDPFGTYEENPIMHNNKKTFAWKMQPYWTSGKEDLSEMGCHELITARGCGVLLKDKGFCGENENGSILIALSLSLASVIPDRRSEYIGLIPYQGHFYDPDTELSIFGNDKNTAKTNAIFFYNQAVNQGISHENFWESMGCLLHYIQDACEPHHAANYYVPKYMSHKYFEEFVDENLNEYIDPIKTATNSTYTNSLNKDIGRIVHDAAVISKSYSSLVKSSTDRTYWNMVAQNTTRLAVIQTAAVLYKLSIDANIPLNK